MPSDSWEMRSPSAAQVSLTLVGLMWVAPFLYWYHAYPLTTFHQEWIAGVLGLCAMPILLARRHWQHPKVPRVVILPAGLLAVGVLQLLLGTTSYADHIFLLGLYLLWAALLMMLGRCLREEFGLPVLVTTLTVFLLVGAELSALAGVLQHYRWHTLLDAVVTLKVSAAVYGNLAQPNHFASYVTLGLISLGLLHVRRLLRVQYVALLTAPLLFVLVLSGSRSAWLYLLYLVGVAWLWQRRDRSCQPLLWYGLLLLLCFGLMHAVVQIPWLEAPAGSVTAMQRLFSEGDGVSIRWYLWQEGWRMFSQSPLVGVGFGQFAWEHFKLVPVLQNTDITGLYNNAHSLIVQVAAEMGLAGLLVLLGTLGAWLIQCGRAPRTVYHWWGCALLGVLGIHSLLEYSLWYAYFIGLASFALGALDATTFRPKPHPLWRYFLGLALLLGALSLAQMSNSYRSLEAMMRSRQATGGDHHLVVPERIPVVRAQFPLRAYFDLLASGKIEVSTEALAEKRALNERVAHFLPIGLVAYREAWLLALSGEQVAAQLQVERAIWSYPNGFRVAHEALGVLAQKSPENFFALLKFALQKYEERQRAVHTR